MFKSTILLSCLCFLALQPYSTDAMTPEQAATIKQHIEDIGKECFKTNPIGADDIKDLRNKVLPGGDGVPCFLACVMKDIGILDAAGMMQKETVLDLTRKVFNDEEEIAIIGDFLHSCSSINAEAVSDGEKGCERAILAYKCMSKNAPKFGLDI